MSIPAERPGVKPGQPPLLRSDASPNGTTDTAAHVCDPLACGISYDPGCPLWDPPPAAEYGTPAWLRSCTRPERLAYDRDRRTAERIRRLGPLAVAALLERLRPYIADVATDVLAEDLPACLETLQKGGRQ